MKNHRACWKILTGIQFYRKLTLNQTSFFRIPAEKRQIPTRLPELALPNIGMEKYTRGVFMTDQLPKNIHQNESGVSNLEFCSGLGTY